MNLENITKMDILKNTVWHMPQQKHRAHTEGKEQRTNSVCRGLEKGLPCGDAGAGYIMVESEGEFQLRKDYFHTVIHRSPRQ